MSKPPSHTHSEYAERQVAGALLRDPEAADKVREFLDGEDDFVNHCYRTVYSTCCAIHAQGKPGGPGEVYQELVRHNQAGELGEQPAAWLFDLYTEVPTAANAEYYARQLRDASMRRRYWHTARTILRDAELPPTDSVEDAIALAADRLHDLIDLAAGRSSSVIGLRDLLLRALEAVDERIASPSGRVGLSSGFETLDRLLGGFRPGQLIVFGARPGVGKTAMLLAVLTAIARAESPAFLASLEMSKGEIGDRLLAMATDVRLNRIRNGKLDARDVERLASATEAYRGCELYVDDTPAVNAIRFAATVRTLVRRHKIQLAAVDYLQLLQPIDRRENRVQQVGRDARELKLIARQCEIPVIAPCQLNREVENRAGGVPKLSDLRESGEIEQHADVVVMLHVPPGQDDDDEVLRVEAHVVKARNASLGKVTLNYRRPVVRFEPAA